MTDKPGKHAELRKAVGAVARAVKYGKPEDEVAARSWLGRIKIGREIEAHAASLTPRDKATLVKALGGELPGTTLELEEDATHEYTFLGFSVRELFPTTDLPDVDS